MGLISKLATAVRGGTREVLELAVDANGLRILAQEIHECEGSIQQAKQDLCRVSAERIRLKREADELSSEIGDKEQRAGIALEKGREDLALEAAEWIAENERRLNALREKQGQLESYENRLKQGLRSAIKQVQDYRAELRMAEATASAQRASVKISSRSDTISVKFTDMQDSLKRIRKRQQTLADEMTAMEQIDADLSRRDLDDRLAEIEGKPSSGTAEAVLERIRNKPSKTAAD